MKQVKRRARKSKFSKFVHSLIILPAEGKVNIYCMIFDFYRQFGAMNSGPIFDAFEYGLKRLGHTVENQTGIGDAAVIWSVLWNGRMLYNRDVWLRYRNQNKPVIVLEIGGLKRDLTWKIGLNGINQGSYFVNDDQSSARANALGLHLKDWTNSGQQILICTQHNKSLQWENKEPLETWVNKQIAELREYTDRPIKLRPHPRCYVNIKGISIDTLTPFASDLLSSWAVINWCSNPGVESIINGVPAFVGPLSLAAPVANFNLSQIELPNRPDRQQWLNNLAWTEWTADEMQQSIPQQLLIREIEKQVALREGDS